MILHCGQVRKEGRGATPFMAEEAIGRELARWPTKLLTFVSRLRNVQQQETTQEIACSLSIIFRKLIVTENINFLDLCTIIELGFLRINTHLFHLGVR